MSCDTPSGMISVQQCRERLLAAVAPLTATETLTLEQATDRILADSLAARLDLPLEDNSAMDGYALHAEDLDGRNAPEIVATVLAGQSFGERLEAGQCVRIMTGAPVPAGAEAVVMQERTRVDGNRLHLGEAVPAGNNIRRRGEDIRTGAPLLPAGRRLGPAEIGLLASQGIASVTVVRRLKVALVSTGDELVAPGSSPGPGQIHDSNRYMLRAALERLGVEVIDPGVIRDDRAELEHTLERLDRQADAIITSGGVSVGEADHVRAVLESLGEIHLWKVAIKPGKPFAFGRLPGSMLFGLPGNPVSALVTLYQLALPALVRMQGGQWKAPPTLRARLADPLRKKPGRADYQRGVLEYDDKGEPVVHSTGGQGSAILTSLTGANCFIVLPAEQGDLQAGEFVTVEPFAPPL